MALSPSRSRVGSSSQPLPTLHNSLDCCVSFVPPVSFPASSGGGHCFLLISAGPEMKSVNYPTHSHLDLLSLASPALGREETGCRAEGGERRRKRRVRGKEETRANPPSLCFSSLSPFLIYRQASQASSLCGMWSPHPGFVCLFVFFGVLETALHSITLVHQEPIT